MPLIVNAVMSGLILLIWLRIVKEYWEVEPVLYEIFFLRHW